MPLKPIKQTCSISSRTALIHQCLFIWTAGCVMFRHYCSWVTWSTRRKRPTASAWRRAVSWLTRRRIVIRQNAPHSGAIKKLQRWVLSTWDGQTLLTTPDGRSHLWQHENVVVTRGNAQDFQMCGPRFQGCVQQLTGRIGRTIRTI